MHRWHYTIGLAFRQIVAEGQIKPAMALVNEGERPIAWFSTNPFWEVTAEKLKRLPDGRLVEVNGIKANAELGGGAYRIGVAPETAPHDWKVLKELSNMSSRDAQGLYKAAVKRGARPGQWFGTFDAVPREKWVVVQSFQNGEWIDVNPSLFKHEGLSQP